jgi:hypothetical protein
MTKHYSKSAGGFYTSEIHDQMPSDVVEITEQEWRDLLNGQSQGKVIKAVDGKPALVDAPPPPPPKVLTIEEKLESVGLSLAELKAALA